jgi:hypothetical protein
MLVRKQLCPPADGRVTRAALDVAGSTALFRVRRSYCIFSSYENAVAVRPLPRIVVDTMDSPFTDGGASEVIMLPSKRKVTNPRLPRFGSQRSATMWGWVIRSPFWLIACASEHERVWPMSRR